MDPTRAAAVLALLAVTACGTHDPSTGTTVTVSPATSASPRVDPPRELPLAAGWPDDGLAEPGPRYGLQGPARDLPPLELRPCGREAAPDDAVDRLTAYWTNVEDFRAREVSTYADAASATTRLAALVHLLRACEPGETLADGYTDIVEIQPLGAGDEGWAVVRRAELAGAPAVGLEVVLLVRVGAALYVDFASNEGGAGPEPEAEARRQVQEQLGQSAEVVAALCASSDADCT